MKLIILTSKESKFDKKCRDFYERLSKDLSLSRKRIYVEGKGGEELVEKYDIYGVPVYFLSEEFEGGDEDDILWMGVPDDYEAFRRVGMRQRGRLRRKYS